jgi:hypothetical protein
MRQHRHRRLTEERGRSFERETGALSEARVLDAMRQAYEAPKTAIPPIDWKQDRQRARYLRVPIVCDCGPNEPIGVSILGTAWTDEPDARVTFQLAIDLNGTDYRIARVDWRPRQPHTNKVGPPGLRGITAYTSIHDYLENAALGVRSCKKTICLSSRKLIQSPLILTNFSHIFLLHSGSKRPWKSRCHHGRSS